ncbi:MAG: methyltransferase domain-containing protein [Acidimicrobiaceae bacterium]|nr:methyltransferase domain-containing protein [Acidimicrobiaceae bacterium]
MRGPRPPDEVIAHYREYRPELDRLSGPQGRIELARTQEILARHLPDRPLRILDVGGATGTYSAWLASLGHEVHLIDPVDDQVQQARQQAGSPPTFTASVGDARALDQPDETFDAVLLFGPLYHLTERTDRLLALREAARVLKPGGFLFAAAISRFASLMDGLARGFLFDPEFQRIVARDLEAGQHRNPTDRFEWFTTAFFHHPSELAQEADEAGFDVCEILGVEGLAGWLPDLVERWSDPAARETMLYSARAVESEPCLLGLSAHLLLVANRVLLPLDLSAGPSRLQARASRL